MNAVYIVLGCVLVAAGFAVWFQCKGEKDDRSGTAQETGPQVSRVSRKDLKL